MRVCSLWVLSSVRAHVPSWHSVWSSLEIGFCRVTGVHLKWGFVEQAAFDSSFCLSLPSAGTDNSCAPPCPATSCFSLYLPVPSFPKHVLGPGPHVGALALQPRLSQNCGHSAPASWVLGLQACASTLCVFIEFWGIIYSVPDEIQFCVCVCV